jgi:hypothetical protein
MAGVNLLNERLSAHEDAIPRMRAVKEQFDNTKRLEKEARDRKIEAAVKTPSRTTPSATKRRLSPIA